MIAEIIIITVSALLAGTVGTLSGFGFGTLLTPILLFFLPFGQTIVLVCIMHWFHDIWKIMLIKGAIAWRLFFYFILPGLITTYAGARLVVHDESRYFIPLLGFFLVVYVLFLLLVPHFILKPSAPTAMTGGAVSGFTTGLFGIRGVIISAFFSAYKLSKANYLVTSAAISLIFDTVRLVTYVYGGIELPSYLMAGLLLFIPASFLGAKIAIYFVHHISEKKFRLMVSLFILVVGLFLMIEPFLLR